MEKIKLKIEGIFLLTILISLLPSCTHRENTEVTTEFTEQQQSILDGFLKDYSKEISFLDDSCLKAFELSLKKANVWPDETIMLESCFYEPISFENKVVEVDSTSDFFAYFYFKHDTTYGYESYFYSDKKGQFIPIHFKDDYIELDPYYIVYLPLENVRCNDMTINSGSKKEDKFNGVFERVDNETHVPIKDVKEE